MRRAGFAAAFAGAALVAPAARGQERDATQAQSLFERARVLMDDGDLEHACPLFAESQRLDPGGGTLLNLALCHERQGKTATAWTEYKEALAIAVRDEREDRRAFAEEHLAAIEPKLPKLRVVVARPAPGLAVRVDGALVSPLAYGLELPVDPGAHEVSASAPGRLPFRARASIAAGARVDLAVPELAAEVRETETRLATASWVLGGVAVAALGASAVTGIVALSADAAAKDKCAAERSFCPDPSYEDDRARASTFAWISTGALAVAAGAAVAAWLWPREHAPRVGVSVGPGEARASAVLSF